MLAPLIFALLLAGISNILKSHDTSTMGRNTQWCCDTVGLSLYSMCRINEDLVFHCAFSSLPDWVVTSVGVVHELLQVRWNCMCLQLLNSHELDFIIGAVCTG